MADGGLARRVARVETRAETIGTVIRVSPRPPVGRLVRRGSLRKRLFDVVVAGALLVALAPVMLLTWIAVRATSRGPGLYWSDRVGYRGRHFAMPKFRTMRLGSPVSAREQLAGSDQHITRIGRVLRRFSIDETPQLFCVLRGDMSLVGPRPLLETDPAQMARAQFSDVMMVRPGLSGLAQVRGRNLLSPRRKARLDAFYARQRSWKLDLAIVVSTPLVVFTGRGIM